MIKINIFVRKFLFSNLFYNHYGISVNIFVRKFLFSNLFYNHYFRPLNACTRKAKDPELKPDPYLWQMDPDADPGDPKHTDSDLEHWV